MQVPSTHPFLWQQVMTSPEPYITSPASNVIIPQGLPHDNLLQVPVMVKNGWIVPGVPQQPSLHSTTYIPQTLHYVTVQPGLSVESAPLDKCGTGDTIPVRPVLVPCGPGRGSAIDCNRSLMGNYVAMRRMSEESPTADIPVKKLSIEDRFLAKQDKPLGKREREDTVLQSIEYYFSDDNLSKNSHLLKQVLHENGYVNLKRIAALRRVKLYARDEHAVAQCIRRSEKLELSEDGTMVRRKGPLPANIELSRMVRSVIAINLPQQSLTIEAVTSLFATYGDLTQVRILKPGKKLPVFLVDYQAWIPDLGKKHCAMVEFESQEEAQNACREINMKNRSDDSLRVALLKPGARLRRTLYRKYKGPESQQEKNAASEESHNTNVNGSIHQSHDYETNSSESNSDSDSAATSSETGTEPNPKSFPTIGSCSASSDGDIPNEIRVGATESSLTMLSPPSSNEQHQLEPDIVNETTSTALSHIATVHR